MNNIHTAIVSYIKEASNNELSVRFQSLTNEQIVRQMFYNYRGERGLRLTQFGLQVMRGFFKDYEIKIPEDEKVKPLHLVYLDTKAKMPYYLGDKEIVVFDHMLGVQLRLVDGRISILMEIEDDKD